MNYYKLTYDMDSVDELVEKGENYIYAESDNLDDLEYNEIKKGRFHTIVQKKIIFDYWPNVVFYYSSKASNKKSDFLLNACNWPIIHNRVKIELEKNNINGIKYYPITLADVVEGIIIKEYYLMYITNFIDAYDLNKSEYKYNDKYDSYTFVPMKTYLNLEVCENNDIFRCIKSPARIFVSDRFRNIIIDNNFNGFSFTYQA